MSPNFTITFTRTINGATSTVTAFSAASTFNGAILDARTQARRADRDANGVIYGDFVAHPARRVLA